RHRLAAVPRGPANRIRSRAVPCRVSQTHPSHISHPPGRQDHLSVPPLVSDRLQGNVIAVPLGCRSMESLIHKYWATWTIQWLCMMALWFAFVSKVELAEALIGVFAAAAAATGHLVIRRRRGFVKFLPKARWFLAFFREP